MIDAKTMNDLARRSIEDVTYDVQTEMEFIEGKIREASFAGLFWLTRDSEVINAVTANYLSINAPRNKGICESFAHEMRSIGYSIQLTNTGYHVDWKDV